MQDNSTQHQEVLIHLHYREANWDRFASLRKDGYSSEAGRYERLERRLACLNELEALRGRDELERKESEEIELQLSEIEKQVRFRKSSHQAA